MVRCGGVLHQKLGERPHNPDLAQCALYQLRCPLGRPAYVPPLPLASDIPFSSLRPAVIAWRRRRRLVVHVALY